MRGPQVDDEALLAVRRAEKFVKSDAGVRRDRREIAPTFSDHVFASLRLAHVLGMRRVDLELIVAQGVARRCASFAHNTIESEIVHSIYDARDVQWELQSKRHVAGEDRQMIY